MQNRENRDYSRRSGSLFDAFGGFGSHRSMMPSIFGGRDPFDDPFFTRPFGNMSGSGMFDASGSFGGSDMFDTSGPFHDSPRVRKSKGPVIEELDTSDEGEEEEEDDNDTIAGDKKYEARKDTKLNKDPIVEHPDDEDKEEQSRDVTPMTDSRRVQGTQPRTRTRSVSFQKVSYGGVDGTYYTASTTRNTGSNGLVVEENKRADKTTGQASHRISRGLHDKGHSVTRKLNPDGKVDTMQTLHNLEEDELTGFEEAWKGNAESHFPGWNGGSDFHGNAGASGSGQSTQEGSGSWFLPFADNNRGTSAVRPRNGPSTDSYGGRNKKVVRINIE